jgi:hypothetical protein
VLKVTEKELLYIEDAVNHEIYMIDTCKKAADKITNESLCDLVSKLIKKHEKILEMFLEIL